MIYPKITKKLDIPLINHPVNFVVFPTFQKAQITVKGDLKLCRFLGKHLRKHISNLHSKSTITLRKPYYISHSNKRDYIHDFAQKDSNYN